jgi:hypothetical protein
MRKDAWMLGIGVSAAWLATGLSVLVQGEGTAWMCVFAFLTAGAVANSHNDIARGVAATIWWAAAGALILIFGDQLAWLSVIAFILTTTSLGFGGFSFPRGLEWDLFDRDDDGERAKIVR